MIQAAFYSLFQDFPEIREKVTVMGEVEMMGDETAKCAKAMKRVLRHAQRNDPCRKFGVGYVIKYGLEELNKGGWLQPVLIA